MDIFLAGLLLARIDKFALMIRSVLQDGKAIVRHSRPKLTAAFASSRELMSCTSLAQNTRGVSQTAPAIRVRLSIAVQHLPVYKSPANKYHKIICHTKWHKL